MIVGLFAFLKQPARVVLVLATSLCAAGCDRIDVDLQCHNESGTVRSVAWIVSGGGAAGWLYPNVSLLTSLEEPTADALEASKVYEARSAKDVVLRWLAPDRLEIVYPIGSVPEKALASWQRGGRVVSIVYAQAPVDTWGGLKGGSYCQVGDRRVALSERQK